MDVTILKNTFYRYLIVLLCFSKGSSAQEKTLSYTQNLSIVDGLAHNGVTSILQDSNGYVWFGTYDGLNKYDGYEFKVFKNTKKRHPLVSNRVRTLAESDDGQLWIGTDEGISIYNPVFESFSSIPSSNGFSNRGIIRKILISPKNDLVFCLEESKGVIIYNKDKSFVKRFNFKKEANDESITFYNAIALNLDDYIISTSTGLFHFNLKSGSYNKILEEQVHFSSAVIKVSQNTFVASALRGIVIVDFSLENDAYNFNLKEHLLTEDRFFTASLDGNRNLWLGTFTEGLLKINNLDKLQEGSDFTISKFKPETGRIRVSSILSSENGIGWVGTFDKGIYKFEINANPFRWYNTKKDYEYSPVSDEVMRINPLSKNKILVFTNGGGISIYDTNKDVFHPLPRRLQALSKFSVQSIYHDSYGDYWAKTENFGFLRFRKNATSYETIPLNGISLPNEMITFAEDKRGNLWLDCNDEVYKIALNESRDVANIQRLNDNSYFTNNKIKFVRTIYADPLHDFIWVGTDYQGLFRLKGSYENTLAKIKVAQFQNDKNNQKSLSHNFVTSVIRLPNEELWIGTEGGGICKVLNSASLPSFLSFDESQGLSNNVVKNILYDNDNNLWLSTNVGLNRFSPKTQAFRTFHIEDGLPFEDFKYASAKLENGLFVFSGNSGFCFFNPHDFSEAEPLPMLDIKSFKLFNQEVLPGDTINNRVFLNKSISQTSHIELQHNEDVFTIELAPLHFSSPRNHYIKYKLKPINDEWIVLPTTQRYVSFSGLPPGDYEFEAMASNAINQWTEPKRLSICIKPPFWKTTYAYILYIIVLVLIVMVIMFFVLRIQNLKHNLELDEMEIKNVKEINEAKLRFFSNISHEIKTPLTLISGPVEVLHHKFKNDLEIRDKLQIVQKQAKKISRLLEQVLDFQRSDANQLKMHYSQFKWNDLLNDVVQDYRFLTDIENKNLKITSNETEIYVSADRLKLEKIVNNILNNAFKFTEANDKILVHFGRDEGDLVLSVEDTGRGIDKEDLPYIFDRFYQSINDNHKFIGGSGIGLAFTKRLVEMHGGSIIVESELNKGTIMTVRLPIILNEKVMVAFEKEQDILLTEKAYDNINTSVVRSDDVSELEIENKFANSLVFYVEDNPEMRTFVSEIISKYFNVETFTNGEECLKAMEQQWPDLIVSDILMPRLNGLDLCKTIKSDIKTSHLPIILLTACTTVDDEINGIKVGADAYVRKPFNISHLVAKVNALLLNRKQLRERFNIDIPLKLSKNDEDAGNHVFLEKLYTLMDENLDNLDLDLDHFAKVISLNRTHFYQKVKAITNCTPYELMREYRIKKASELLLHENKSIKEVILMTGFKSRSHFSNTFKNKYGVSPGQYVLDSKQNSK